MDIKQYSTCEITRDKNIQREVTFESRVHNVFNSELLIQIKDIGEFNEIVSCLVLDKTDMKRLRQILNHCIGDRKWENQKN